MNNLDIQARAFLSPSRRVRRGFARLGLLLMAGTLLAGSYIAFEMAQSSARYWEGQAVGFTCLKRAYADGRLRLSPGASQPVDVAASGCPDAPLASLSEVEQYRGTAHAYWPQFWRSLAEQLSAVALFAALAFVLPFGFGWVLLGFFRD